MFNVESLYDDVKKRFTVEESCFISSFLQLSR